jgi:hypothetical protein
MDTALLLALDELRARGTRVCHSTTSLVKATFFSGLKTTKHFFVLLGYLVYVWSIW